ncbi:MAG: hypothetical protein ABIA76_02610 [Candidatus Diapherotrites archaeon]
MKWESRLFFALIFASLILFSGCFTAELISGKSVGNAPAVDLGNLFNSQETPTNAMAQNQQQPSQIPQEQLQTELPPAEPEEQDANQNLQELTKQDKINECSAMDLVEKNSCLNALALNEKDLGICRSMDLLGDECIKELAVEEGNSELCREINGRTVRENCFHEFSEQEKECREITNGNLRDECYSSLAATQKNYLFCRNISSSKTAGSYARDECYTSLLASNKFIELCEAFLDFNLSQDCYMEVAEADLNLSLCEFITEAEDWNTCIYYIAENTYDINTCKLFSTHGLSQKCIVSVAEKTFDADLCETITSSAEKDSCYYSVADANLLEEYCDKITNTQLKNECYLNLATETDDGNICTKITNIAPEWETCNQTVAESTNEYSLCERLRFSENYIECFVNVAVALERPEVCITIQKRSLSDYSIYPIRDLCYKNTAIELELNSLCEEITDGNLMKACEDGNSAFH